MGHSLNDQKIFTQDLLCKLVADKSQKESLFLELNLKNRLLEMGFAFEDEFHFHQFCGRITRVIQEHGFNNDLISFYLDYKDLDNRGRLIGRLHTNVETLSDFDLYKVEMRMNFKFTKE